MSTLFWFLFLCGIAIAQDVRPIRDDIGYCWDPQQMKRLVDYLASVETDSASLPGLVAGISPHDDYLYAGRVYYPLFRTMRAKEVVIFGVTHRTVRKEIGDPQNVLILDEYSAWRGLTGDVPISPLREFIKQKLDTSFFLVSNKAHQLEHSIEGLLPFLHYFNPTIRIVPIMVTVMPVERMQTIAKALAKILVEYTQREHLVPGKDIIFLMSSDANHYGRDFDNIPYGDDASAHRKAVGEDMRIGKSLFADTVTEEKIHNFTLEMGSVVWCGRYSIPFGLLTAQKTVRLLTGHELVGKMLRYSDSYSGGVLPLTQTGMGTTGPFSLKHWVGYLSAGVY